MRFDARAWMVWILTVALLSMFARNPLYSMLLLVLSLLAVRLFARNATLLQPLFLRISITILLFSAVYHALFIHVGDHVLFQLPGWPLVGGEITVEALLDGLRNGLVLISLLAAFMALNAIVPSREMIRLVPVAFHDLSVVILIAVTYIPETRRHWQRIQEAQAIRGHQPKGLRDWRPLLVPLLVGGLERAMNLSEAMVARGTIQIDTPRKNPSRSLLLIGGLLASLLGWLVAVIWGVPGYVLIAAGAMLLTGVILHAGRQHRRTRYVRTAWSIHDTLLVITALSSMVLVFIIWPLLGNQDTSYNPYPSASLPEFQPLIAVATLFLSYPILLGVLTTEPAASEAPSDYSGTAGEEFGQIS